MGARMVPANGQTTKTKKIYYMSFWLERLSILLQIYTFVCNFYSRKGGRASIRVPCFYWDIYGKSNMYDPHIFESQSFHKNLEL